MARRLFTLLALVAALTASQAALAADIGGPQPFGAAPASSTKLGPRSYFDFALGAGLTAHDKVVVTNAGKKPQTLKLGVSTGVTAVGSGDAYANAFGTCRAAACWITGLPASITLGPGARRTIPFTVTVPAGTPDRQYLAGITVQPSAAASTRTVGKNGSAGARATIVQQVVVGVAITVGDLSQLITRLEVTAVSATTVATKPRLLIREHNVGQTFVHARGVAACLADGEKHTFPVISSTILPGDSTTLTVNAEGLPTGKTASCSVSLGYGKAVAAAWHGSVHTPSVHPGHVIQTGPGSYSTIPDTSKATPRWVWALIGLGGLIVVLLVAMLVVLLRRPRTP